MGGMEYPGPDGAVSPAAALGDFIMRWTECLHGAGNLRATLMAFADCARVEVVALHRTNLDTGHQRTMTFADQAARHGARPFVRAFGPALVTVRPQSVRLGSIWSLGEIEPAGQDMLDHRVLRWMEDRGLRDAGVVPLGRTGNDMDFLEFYSTLTFRRRDLDALDVIATAAATAWGRREKGRIARLLRVAPALADRLGQRADATASPLSAENPWGLTPAELRICTLIRDGCDPAEISARTTWHHRRSGRTCAASMQRRR